MPITKRPPRAAMGVVFLAAAIAAATPARSETKPLTFEGPDKSSFTLGASYRGRVEFADWFEAGPPQENSDYVYMGNRFQLGVTGKWKVLSGMLQYQHTILTGVPEDAPGIGGTYRANTDHEFQQRGWLRQGWMQADLPGGNWRFTMQGGRFRYLDGMESVSKNPSLEWLRKNRIAERLLGPFDFTHVGRSFDGARVAADGAGVNLSGFFFLPTSGGFEVSAGDHMDIQVGGASAMLKDDRFPGTEARLFFIHYDDERPEHGDVVVLDNRPLADRQADDDEIAIETVGGDFLHVEDFDSVLVDTLVWAAGQTGDWQSQDHSAWAVAVESGMKFPHVWAAPWLRIGYFRSSGDDDPGDGDHDTFFQLVPTARLYAYTPFYNLMNNQDVMLQLIASPHAALRSRTDFHWLSVSEDEDILYFGGGATKRKFFGYGGTPAGGASDNTAYVVEQTLMYTVSRNVDLHGYVGHAFGQGVVENGFPRDDELTYGFVECTLTF